MARFIGRITLIKKERPEIMEIPEDPLVELRETTKGRGVFARSDIAAGTHVIIGQVLSSVTHRTRYSLQIDFDSHVDLDEPGKLVNHSCDPNTFPKLNRFGGYSFVARRNIAADEEISFDYDMSEFFSIAVPECLCESTKCRGRTKGLIHLSDEKRTEYGLHLGDYALRWMPVPEQMMEIDQSTHRAFLESAYHTVTKASLELYRTWLSTLETITSKPLDPAQNDVMHSTEAGLFQNLDVLEVTSSPSLFSAFALAPLARKYTIFTPVILPSNPVNLGMAQADLVQDKTASEADLKSAVLSFDWKPYVMLAEIARGEIDPSVELLRARQQHLSRVLNITHQLPHQNETLGKNHSCFDFINLSDATHAFMKHDLTQSEHQSSTTEVTDTQTWLNQLMIVVELLKPNGFLMVTVNSKSYPRFLNHARSQVSSPLLKPLQIEICSPGSCIEVLESLTRDQRSLLTLVDDKETTAPATSRVFLFKKNGV